MIISKLFKSFIWGGLLSLANAAKSEAPIGYHLKGIIHTSDYWAVSIKEQETLQQRWMRKGNSFGHLKVLDFISEENVVLAEYMERPVRLEIEPAKASSKHSIPRKEKQRTEETKSSPNRLSESEITQKVEHFRKSEEETLLNLDANVRSIIAPTLEQRVSAFEANLRRPSEGRPVDSKKPIEGEEQNLSLANPIINQRAGNSVNSSPWTSNHIEEFGLPEL